ncbi:nucleoside hydrolase [Methylophaga sp.]|uniref:nucleoside hydrolase n=1 Tax=Methylophaga sp. TaxID=2024840 RepID=UPI0027234405|nr:nucleoside hydrolase [Methylophaga sp.]MDO8826870.1 nucleoside hydrolase [Methylophaga sp.]
MEIKLGPLVSRLSHKVNKYTLLGLLSVITSPAYAYPVILDTDFTLNSIIYFAKNNNTDLQAITIACSGEAHCEPGKHNAIRVLDLLPSHPEVPVAAGDDYPLDGFFVFPAQWREAIDNFGSSNVINSEASNVNLPPASYKPSELSAVELIHQTISQSTEAVTIVADGPLTNIAQWLLQYPADVDKVDRLVIMGGALNAGGNIIVKGFTDDHPNTKAEWNFLIDPLAVKIVFSSALNIVLVPLDATNYMLVTNEYVTQFDSLAHTPEAEFISNIYKINGEFIASGEYYFWDELANLVTTHPELCGDAVTTPLEVKVDYLTEPDYVQTSDLSMPATRWDGKPRQHIKAETAGVISRSETGQPITVCMTTQAEKAFHLFTETLTQ